MVVLGLVKDTLPCLATVNRLTINVLMALLDGMAGSAHAVAATKLGGETGGDSSDVASVSGASDVCCTALAAAAEGAAHRTIDRLHGTTRAVLLLSRQLGCGSTAIAKDRLSHGCETLMMRSDGCR